MSWFKENPRINYYKKLESYDYAIYKAKEYIRFLLDNFETGFRHNTLQKKEVLHYMDEIAKELDALFVYIGFGHKWIELVVKERKAKVLGILTENERIEEYNVIKENSQKIKYANQMISGHLNNLAKRMIKYQKAGKKRTLVPAWSMMEDIAKEMDALFVSLGYGKKWINFIIKESK